MNYNLEKIKNSEELALFLGMLLVMVDYLLNIMEQDTEFIQ